MTPYAATKRACPPSLRVLGIVLMTSTALVTTVSHVHGQTMWTGATSPDWFTASNWHTGIVPNTGAEDVLINTQASNPVLITVPASSGASVSINSLALGSGAGADGRLTINVEQSAFFNFSAPSTGQIVVGAGGGTGQLDFNLPSDIANTSSGQADLSHGLLVGSGQGSVGTVNILATGKNPFVMGSFPSHLASGKSTIGSAGGTGTVNVDGGAWFLQDFSGSSGNLDQRLRIGADAGSVGTLNVLSGGKLSFGPTSVSIPAGSLSGLFVGDAGGTGTLNVSGSNATVASTVVTGLGLTVGNGAGSTGAVNILSGGKLSSYNTDAVNQVGVLPAQIGVSGGTGSALVSGAGSELQIAGITTSPSDGQETGTGDLFVGLSGGNGALTLADGGTANLGAFTFVDHSTLGINQWGLRLESPDSSGVLFLAQDAGSTGMLNFGAPAGQAPAAPGTLNAAGVVFGAGTGAIAFNHTSSNLQFNTPISGNGSLNVLAGTTVIGIDNSAGFTRVRRDFDLGTGNFADVSETFGAGFSGFTNMFGGTLGLANDFAIGSSTVHAIGNATLAYLTNPSTSTGVSIANPITVDPNITLALSADSPVSAVQSGAISGAGNIDKLGTGTLTLTADNPITGQVGISGGTLALSGGGEVSSASRVVANGIFDIANAAGGASIQSLAGGGTTNLGGQTLTITNANDLFSGVIQGTGGLTLTGGTQTLSGANTYAGPTSVVGGTLQAGATNTFSPNSDVSVAAGGALALSGFDQTIPSLANAGLVSTGGAPGTTLTVAGNYIGNGGLLSLNTTLGDSSSITDKLVVQGNTSGVTGLLVTNIGGGGAQTTGNGIQVVQVNGASDGVFTQGNRVAAGAYEYLLFKNGIDASSADGNWYLRSTLVNPDPGPGPGPGPGPTPPLPNFRVEVPVDMAVPALASRLGLGMLGTYRDRVGDDNPAELAMAYGGPLYTKAPRAAGPSGQQQGSGWGRVFGEAGAVSHGGRDASGKLDRFLKHGSSFDFGLAGLQAGMDLLRREYGDGSRDNAGLYFAGGHIGSDVNAVFGGKAGSVSMNAYSVGGYWTRRGVTGWYLDAVLQGTWFDQVRANSVLNESLNPNGHAFAASLEGGFPFALGGGWSIEPQAQVVYQRVSFDQDSDRFGLMTYDDTNAVYGRVGARLLKTWIMEGGRAVITMAKANFWHTFGADAKTTFTGLQSPDGTTLVTSLGGSWAQLGLGISGRLGHNTSVFASGDYNVAVDHGSSHSFGGRVGVKYTW